MNQKLEPKKGKIVQLAGKRGQGVLEIGKKIYIGTVNIFIPPLAHYHTGRYTGKKHHLVLDTFLAILMFILLGAGLYWRAQIRHIFFDEINMELSSSQELVSGQESDFILDLANETDEVLKDITVRFDVDNRFKLSDDRESWNLAELAPHQTSQISFSGTPLGMTGDKLAMKSFVTYTTLDDKRSGLFKTTDFEITDSFFSLSVEFPEVVSVSQPFEAKVVLASKGELAAGVVSSFSPESLLCRSAVPPSPEEAWSVSSGEEKKEIQLNYAFLDSAMEQESVIFEYSAVNQEEKIILAKKEVSIQVVHPEISISLQADSESLSPGSKTNLKAAYQNNGSVDITNAVITCSISGDNGSIDSANGFVSQNTVTFTSKNSSGLARITPGQKGDVSYSVAAAPGQASGQVNASCSFSGTALKDSEELEVKVYCPLVEISVLPSISFNTYGSFEAGPLPPQVGYPTTYRLFFEISDPAKSIHDMTVTASLPAGVDWQGNTSALAGAAPAYSEMTRQVTWSVKQYPEQAGKLQASFEVRIIPNQNHIGYPLELLTASTLNYSHAYGTTQTSLTADHLTTQLKGDLDAQEKGTVIE